MRRLNQIQKGYYSMEDREFVKNCAEEFRKNNLVEDSDFLAVTCNKPFIVDPEKWEEFKKMKPNPELMKKIEEASKKLNIKVEIEEGPVLRKVIKPDKK